MRKLLTTLVCALAVLGVAFVSHAAVPLYDGVNFPDEPYRYVTGTLGKTSALQPTNATATSPMVRGYNTSVINLYTGEQGAQLYMSLGMHSLSSAKASQLVTVQAQPLIPNGGSTHLKIVSVEYRVSATSDNGSSVKFAQVANVPTFVDMRLPQGYPVGAAIVYRTSQTAAWRKLVTSRVGNDIYEADVVGFGDYAVIQDKLTSTGDSHGKAALIAVPCVILGLIVGSIVIINRRARKGDTSQKLSGK